CESATSSALSRAELETERWRWTSEVDERFMARVRELGDEIREKLSAIKLDHESSAAELAQLIQRFMRIESESRCGTAELRAELGAHREASRNRESDRKANEALLKEQIARLDQAVSSLESNVREQAAAAAAKHARQWDEFVARVDALAATRVNDVTSAADLSGWKDELEKSLAPRFAAVEAVLNEQRRHAELNAGTGDSLTLQMHALTERIANLEIASQGFQALGSEGRRQTEQVAEALKTDLASFKAEVTAQLQMLPTPDQSLKTIEDKFALKLDALQAQILQTQLASEDYGRQFLGLRSEIQTLVQRLSETESATQQTHALMVNECGQEAQWRDGLRSEHESLRAQVAAIQPNDNALRALEEGFQREIGALEDRLIQKWRLLEQQDADLRELKAQFQNFAQQSNPADAVLPVSPVTPFAPTVAVPVDISALRAQREASSVGSIKAQPQSVVVGPVDNQEPSETLSNVNRDQLKQLQERLSADIERARNELREKSGRWKVRR
ncbi:MAG TPA: hypothetical protein VMT22_13465, partial [Terriglobales bacterium]|nr:hypothetical protein [Terriglobales bacterium]